MSSTTLERERRIGWSWLIMLLATLACCAIFWLYHYCALKYEFAQTQTNYYHDEFVPLYALFNDQWHACLRILRWSLPPLIIFAIWLPLVLWQAIGDRVALWAWLPLCFIFALCINVAAARQMGGYDALLSPFGRYDIEYSGQVGKVGDDPALFIRDYAGLVEDRALGHHSDIHPPGGILFLWLMQKWFGQGLFQMCAGAIFISALAIVPTCLMAQRLYGRPTAIIAAGLFIITPSIVLFGATCMDGVFAILPICALWLFIEAIAEHRSLATSIVCAILMGAALTGGLFMTYATVCIGIFAAIYGLLAWRPGWKHFFRALLVNCIAAAIVVAFYSLAMWRGWYDIVACLRGAVEENQLVMGTGRETLGTWLDVSTTNLMAFLIDVGAVIVCLWIYRAGKTFPGIRRRSADIFMIAGFLTVLVVSFSSMFHFEVERIWLFLVPLLTIPAARSLVNSEHKVKTPLVLTAMILLFFQTYITELLLYTYW